MVPQGQVPSSGASLSADATSDLLPHWKHIRFDQARDRPLIPKLQLPTPVLHLDFESRTSNKM